MPISGGVPAKRIESLRTPCLCPKAPLTRVSIRWQPVPVPPCSPIFFLRKPNASLTPPRERHAAVRVAGGSAVSGVCAGFVSPGHPGAGLDLGRAVAARVIEYLKMDGKKWEGTVPAGPGLWGGSNPRGGDDGRWERFALS